jgi:hypothetical protein
MTLPNLCGHVPRNGNAVLQSDAFNGNERYYVGGADAWMRAFMLREVDYFGSFADAANSSLGDSIAISNQSDDATVVVGVHLFVEEIDTIEFHRRDDGFDFCGVAAFGKVWDTFDERGHKGTGYSKALSSESAAADE